MSQAARLTAPCTSRTSSTQSRSRPRSSLRSPKRSASSVGVRAPRAPRVPPDATAPWHPSRRPTSPCAARAVCRWPLRSPQAPPPGSSVPSVVSDRRSPPSALWRRCCSRLETWPTWHRRSRGTLVPTSRSPSSGRPVSFASLRPGSSGMRPPGSSALQPTSVSASSARPCATCHPPSVVPHRPRSGPFPRPVRLRSPR